MSHTHGLSSAEAERLHLTIRELGLLQKTIGEALMNGYGAIGRGELVNNRVLLLQHMAGVNAVFSVLMGCKDIDGEQLLPITEAKLRTMTDYMRFHKETAIGLAETTNDINEKTWGSNVFRFFRRGKKQNES